MKKIKFKVKHIIYTLSVMFVLIPTLLFAAGTLLYNSRSESLRSYSNVFLSMYTKFPILPFTKGEAYFKLGESTFNLTRNMIFIRTDGSYSYSEEARSKDYLYRAIDYYTKGIEIDEDSKYYVLNYNRAIALYTLSGQSERVEALVDKGLKSKNETVRLNAARNQVVFDIKNRRYMEGLERCNSFLDIWEDDYKLRILRGDLYFLLGDLDRARQEYKGEMEPVKLNLKREASYIDYPSGDRRELIRGRSNAGEKGIIKGRVTNGDKPIPYAFITLENTRSGITDDTMNLKGMNSAGFGFTDEQGFYEITNVPFGSHFLKIVVPGLAVENVFMVQESSLHLSIEVSDSSIIERNIKFSPFMDILQSGIIGPENDYFEVEWKPVEDAVKYIVSLEVTDGDNFQEKSGVTMSYEYTSVTENKVRLNRQAVSLSRILFPPVFKTDWTPTTASYIGYIDGRGLGIYIQAVDKGGRVISKTKRESGPIIPGINRELNEGEKLILENKLVEGKNWFENQLRNNPEDKNALYNLARMYSLGIKGEYKDHDKATEYAKRIYNLNGDKTEYERIMDIIRIRDF